MLCVCLPAERLTHTYHLSIITTTNTEGRPVLSPSTGEAMAPVCVPNHSLKLLIKDFLRTAARKQAKQQRMQMQALTAQQQQQQGVFAA